MELAALLDEALALKEVARAGWVRVGVPEVESVAAHSWGVAWMALVLAPEELDRQKLLTYAVLHDLAEVRVGDLTPQDRVSRPEKARREAQAIDALLAQHPALRAAWHAYEAQADGEARFVRELDRLDMALQAKRYARTTGVDTSEFVQSADAFIQHPALRALL